MENQSFESIALRFASRQHGVAARRQLLAAGIAGSTINHRIRIGYLFRLFRGTYAVGRQSIDRKGLWMAGVLSAGEDAVLGYRSAADAWGFLRSGSAVEVVRPSPCERQKARVLLGDAWITSYLVVRRTKGLPARDVAAVDGIPVATVERALMDLSALLPPTAVRRAFIEADRLGLLKDQALAELASRDIRRLGMGVFREMTGIRLGEVGVVKSLLEAIFIGICKEHKFESPETNVDLLGCEIDCVWRNHRVAVELDSYEFHRGREKFEEDASRSNRFRAKGWTLLRFTWRMLTGDPDDVATQVKQVLEATRPSE